MTVSELIAALQKMPQEALVVADNADMPNYLLARGPEMRTVREDSPGIFEPARAPDGFIVVALG